MEVSELEEILNSEKEYEFSNPNRRDFSTRRDLAVMNFLHGINPESDDIICAAEHDQIWLDFDIDLVASKITEEEAYFLRDSGVFISEDAFSMFV